MTTLTRFVPFRSPLADVAVLQNRLNSIFNDAGIKQDALDVNVENQTLTVKGERKFENEEKQENFHRIERRYGTFTRTFTLPPTVDTGAVKANYDAGVLTISLAKKEAAKPKQVKVEIGTTAAQPKQVEAKTA